ncbi:MAG: molybdopterin-dependent oxidoreductase [Chloroflexi bacterium]|nr:molybdopterin-dependent oxidoreductase [Chloroflexota bacterium]
MAKNLTRREFVVLAGASTTGAVLFAACNIPEAEFVVQSPTQLPEDLVRGIDAWYATTLCCEGGDSVIVRVMEGRAKKIAGNPDFPINLGKQNVRAESALQMLYHPDRIKTPLARRSKGAPLRPVLWDEAEAQLKGWAEGSGGRITIATNPMRGHAAWVVGNFAKEYGGRHIAFDPLDQGTLHAAIKKVFGQDRLPEFDIENAQTILSIGADWLGTWVSPTRYGVKYGQFRQGEARTRRGMLFHAESRMPLTAAAADRWLPVRPGAEGDLALGVAHEIIEKKLVPDANVQAYLAGINRAVVDAYTADRVTRATGLSAERIHELAEKLAHEGPSLVIGGGSAGAHTNGVQNLSAIYALNYLLGSVGARGGVWFNPPSPFEGVPDSATGASFAEWEKELAGWRAGNVSTLILREANVVHGLPRSADPVGAIAKVEHVVAFATVLDDTTELADLVLPEHSALEDWGTDVPEPGPGYPLVAFQQPVVGAAYTRDGAEKLSDSRGFADTLLRVSGGKAGGDSMRDVVNKAARALFARKGGSVTAPTEELFLKGVLARGGWWDGSRRQATAAARPGTLVDGELRSEFSETEAEVSGEELHLVPFAHQSLMNGRLAAAPWAQATPDPITSAVWATWAELNPETAARLDVREGDRLIIRSSLGEIEALAYVHPAAAPDTVAVPVGQGHASYGRYARGRGANVLSILVDKKDSETGALAWAATRVKVSKAGGALRVPKFEGSGEVARQAEPGVPVITVREGESAEDAKHRLESGHKVLE